MQTSEIKDRTIDPYTFVFLIKIIKGNITFWHSNCKNSKYLNSTERSITCTARLARVAKVGRVGKHHESNVCKRNGIFFDKIQLLDFKFQ